MINLALPSFQLYVKEREAKLHVDIAYNAYYETILKVIKCSKIIQHCPEGETRSTPRVWWEVGANILS